GARRSRCRRSSPDPPALAGRYAGGGPRRSLPGDIQTVAAAAPPADPDKLAQLRSAIGDRTVIAGASTHAGEEAVLIEMHRRLRDTFPGLLTIIAPRHPERGAGILDLAKAANLQAALRSRGELPSVHTDI